MGEPRAPQRIEPMAPPAKAPGKKTIGGVAAMLIAGVIAVEGGYVNHAADPGGETNMGITRRVAEQAGYHGPMRQLPRDVAESIYYDRYLVGPGYAPLIDRDAAITEELFDTTVNMGPARPSRWFQQSINALCGTRLAVDGRVGPATVTAFTSCQARLGPARLCVAMLDALDADQRAEYDRLVRANPRLNAFYRGWINNRIGNVDRAKCSAGRAA
jgi:lysozyme family protein